jgi:uncharacterized protein
MKITKRRIFVRRNDREINKIETIIEIIEKCEVCIVSFFDADYPYIVPLNFGYSYNPDMEELSLYFHGANKGKKLDLIKENNKVAFEMDCSKKLIVGESPCEYTMEFESLCGNGKIEILEEKEKLEGLKYIMNQYSDDNFNDSSFDEKILKFTTVLKLTVKHIVGKRLKK